MSEFDLLSFRRFHTIIMILNKIKLLFISQLEKLLEEVRKVTLNEKGEFSSKSALFVCNKWDQIPQKEIEEVKKYVIRKLEKCWRGLVPESQIIYMSAKKAIDAQKLGIIMVLVWDTRVIRYERFFTSIFSLNFSLGVLVNKVRLEQLNICNGCSLDVK